MAFNERVAIVTGGAKGNGKGAVEALASRGAKVVIMGHPDQLDETIDEMIQKGYEVSGFVLDVTDKARAKECVDATFERYGRIDILVNNAGICYVEAFCDTTDEKRNLQHDINVNGAWNLTQCILPYMIEAKHGRIINLSSVAGPFVAKMKGVSYGTTKAALIGFTKCLALEVADQGITVNAICPGFVHTPMVDKAVIVRDPEHPEKVLERFLNCIPVGRFGKPSDIGELVAYLASEETGYVTGASIVIDGGGTLPEFR